MTALRMFSGFSAELANHEEILSAVEKELLRRLLQESEKDAGHRPELAKAMRQTIDRVVGEMVSQRAFALVGRDILDDLLQGESSERWSLGSPPTVPPPGDMPRPPGPSPRPPGQSPTGISAESWAQARCQTAVEDQPSVLLPQAAVLEEFLVPQELNSLIQYTLARELEFKLSEVLSPGVDASSTNFESRRSLVLMELGPQLPMLGDRLRASLPRVFEQLEHSPFSPNRIEAQITASNDGDFFRRHSDNAHPQIATRELTFVYFFHREPKAFHGGELRLYESRWENGAYVPTSRYRSILPEQNQVVFFPSALIHEITPVECHSSAFSDSRFTVNGWLHR
jgi:SM-20-related protein